MASVGLLMWGPEFGLRWCWGVQCDIKADLVTVSVCSAGFGCALWIKEFHGTASGEPRFLSKSALFWLAGVSEQP